ncbi:hypothetical protein ACE6H2_011113 [Prunus campanulata]
MMAGTKGGIGKPGNSSDSDMKKLKPKKQKPDGNVSNHEVLVQGDEKSDHVKKKSYKHQVLNENDPSNLQKAGDLEKESQKKKQKKNPLHTVDNTKVGKKLEKAKVKQQGELVKYDFSHLKDANKMAENETLAWLLYFGLVDVDSWFKCLVRIVIKEGFGLQR